MSEEPKETALAYNAFLAYCEMGRGRSLLKLAQKFGGDSGKIRSLERTYEKWSSQHSWQDRVKQYDESLMRERVAKKQEKCEEMEDRHAKEAKEEQSWARDVLKEGKDRKKISLAAVQLLKNSRDDERKAMAGEEKAIVPDLGGAVIGIAIYLPQKQALKGGDADVSSESRSD